MNISSQDFRNAYEKFYNKIRNYLWPYDTLLQLANIEVDIYSAFIDYESLRRNLDRLYRDIRETMEDDEYLTSAYDKLSELCDDALGEDVNSYLAITQVEEVNPETNKRLNFKEADKDEDNKETVSPGFGGTVSSQHRGNTGTHSRVQVQPNNRLD